MGIQPNVNVGDTVKLKSVGKRTGKPSTAVVKRIRKDGGVLLDQRLAGFQWWHMDDLVVVRVDSSTKGK